MSDSMGLLTTAHFFSCLLPRPLSLSCHPSLPALQAAPSLILRPTDLMNRRVCVCYWTKSFPQRRQQRGTEQVLAKKRTAAGAKLTALCYIRDCGSLTGHLSLFYSEDQQFTSSYLGCQNNEKSNFLVLLPASHPFFFFKS